MIGVDQVDAKLLCREEAVVLHVCRHEGVAALRSRQLQHIPAGAAANRDSFHWQATVHIPQPVDVQTPGNIGQKFRHGHGVRKLPYTSAGKRAPVGRRTGRLQAARDLRAQRRHERIIDAAVGNVQIRVHTDGGNAVPRHGQHLASGEIIRRRVPQRRKDERVVRNNELRAQLDRFCDHGVCDVQRQQRIFYRSSTVTNQKTGVIKIHLIPHRRDLI